MAETENDSLTDRRKNHFYEHECFISNASTTATATITTSATPSATSTASPAMETTTTLTTNRLIHNSLVCNECDCYAEQQLPQLSQLPQQYSSKKRYTQQHSQHNKPYSSCTAFCQCRCYCHSMGWDSETKQCLNTIFSSDNSMPESTLQHDCCSMSAEVEEMDDQKEENEIDDYDYEYDYNEYEEDDYNSLQYSFKGIPPELYSAKKEFIYTRPLVQQQLVLKKTCEWWFYKVKCSNNNNNNNSNNNNNMSTYWKQNSFLIFIISIITLLGIIIFFCLPLKNATHMEVIITDHNNSSNTSNRRINNSSSNNSNNNNNSSSSSNSNDLTILNHPRISTTTTTTTKPSKITAITELTTRANVKTKFEFPALHDNHRQHNYMNQTYNITNNNNNNNNNDSNSSNSSNNIENIHDDNDSDNENENGNDDWSVNSNDDNDNYNDNENDIEEDIHGNIVKQLTIDYVIPIKMVNFSLSPDDLLYESKRNLNIHHYNNNNNNNNNYNNNNNNNDNSDKQYFSSYKLTGTFRNTSSQIWDPHPEYILNVFGHRLHLILHQDVSFIPLKTFRVINILDNMSEDEVEQIEPHYLGCYYKGYIEGDSESAVSVSLCHGMTGYIKTSFGTLLIQPVNQTIYDAPLANNNNNNNNESNSNGNRNHNNNNNNISSNSNSNDKNNLSSSKIMHKVWRHSGRNARHAVSILDLDLNEFEKHIMPKNKKKRKKKIVKEKMVEVLKDKGQKQIILSRRKRDYYDDHRTIELLLGVDRTMKEFHKHNLNSYVLMLMSIVSNVFADASIGNVIHISVVNILVLNDYDRSKRKPIKGRALLRDFCYRVNARGYHYDTAMLLTRNQICSNRSSEACDAIGLAEVGTICRRSSCSIVQDNGLSAAFTIVHELGHILNVPHDDSKRCENFNMHGKKYIMSSMMSDDIHPWSWSDCSRHYIFETLEREDKSCLHDTHGSYIHNYNRRLPGEIYSLDDQCRLIHGNASRYCAIEIDCKRLWCKIHDSNSDCRSSGLPWAEGTPCNDNTFWCQKGNCVPRDLSVRPVIHGGWGPWSPFTDCSLPCGGGVQKSTRECNNPKPRDGGKYCSGAHKKYRSCNTHNCPPGSRDAREEQCYQQKFKNHNIPGVPPNANWIPKYGLDDNKMCSLYCRLENGTDPYNFGEVIDGTVCSLGSTDKCVNGVCRPAGCDNELNSMAKLDKCGVCEGRNDTCEEFTGNFYVSDLYKAQPKSTTYYYYVTTIPKDASNIVVEQPGYHQENYIVLRDDQGKTLLNGDGVVPYFTKYIPYAGVLIEYNGSNNFIERVNTTYMARLKRDLRLEIISLTSTNSNMDNDTLLMTYTYTISKPNYMDAEVEIYRWEMQQWSICDALCQGSMHRVPVCVSTVQALKVAPQFCDAQAKPPNDYRPCNTDCILTLNVTSVSECSAQCGTLGSREKTYACIQTFPEVQRSNTVDMKYCLAKFEFNTHEECREGCWQYRDWSTCTKSCGYGLQTRTVGCYFNQSFVHDDYCNLATKANYRDTSRVCNQNKCQYTREISQTAQFALSVPPVAANNWRTGEWGKCKENCIKTRTVKCRNPRGHGCPIDKKPPNKRKCCVIKYVSNWSQCSTQCGNGVRRKEFHCARVYKPDIKGTPRHREFIDASYCRHMPMPKARRREKPCKISCKWSASQWTHCSDDCTNTYQTRSVYCETMYGNLINNAYCDETKKPNERKICNNCIKREYKVVASCNCEGLRKRRLICYDSHRRRIHCPTKEKIIREKCTPPRHCYPTSCNDIRRFHRTYENGEYTIYVRSIPKKIYCHDMKSAPKEYLTVNATENYSIYYDNKTSNPDECPPESRSKEYRDDSLLLVSGRTTFHKIRIDLTTLRIYESDFTFADTRGKAQAYGSAGDCYNRRKLCPQGDFSINLEQTGFHIKHGTVWETYGHHVVIKESNSNSHLTHRALCGGWCGGCRIASNSALYLDV